MKRLALPLLLCLTLLEHSLGQPQSHTGKGFDYESALAPLRQTIANSIPGKPDTNTLDAWYQIADIYNIRSRGKSDQLDTFYVDSSIHYAQLLIDGARDRKSTRLNSSHLARSRMPSSA